MPRLGSYVYHREGRFAGKFFCIPHSTATALEKYRFKKKTDEIQETEQKRKDARDSAVTKVERRAKHSAISPSNRDRLLEPKRMPLDRGATPERMTYEATLDMSEESGLEQIDEDEWTDRNFGNSTANDVNTSDDSLSDLESDDEARVKAGVANASGGPLTVGETRRLAREWRARYKGLFIFTPLFILTIDTPVRDVTLAASPDASPSLTSVTYKSAVHWPTTPVNQE